MRIVATCLLLMISAKVFGQNLVPNYSFEDTIACPYSIDEIHNTKYWFKPTVGTSDYFHECSELSDISVPDNIVGYQIAKTGKAYAGFASYFDYLTDSTREYIEVKLKSPLDTGKKYCIEYYLSLSDSSKYATDAIGIYLSSDSVASSIWHNLPFTPQVVNTTGNFITDKYGWSLISGEYIATGGEQFITIGNFWGDSNTNILNVGGYYGFAYYYIDDVSVVLCDTPYCAGLIQPKIYTTNDTVLLDSATMQFIDSSQYASSWQWDFGDPETSSGDTVQNPVHTYDSVGAYTVRLVAGYGNCTDTAYKQIVVDKDVGISQFKIQNSEFKIIPNPSNGEMILEYMMNDNYTGAMIISDIMGREIKEYKLNSNTNQVMINEHTLDNGIYLYKIIVNDKVVFSDKLIIIK